MTTDVIPIMRVSDAGISAQWYARLGFELNFEHRFEPHLPAYVGIRRDGAQLHLSEHAGDARRGTLVYIWVDSLDPIAAEFGVTVDEAPWGREIYLSDPDHNRLRVAEALPRVDADDDLGSGTAARLISLERSMWRRLTRVDPAWLDAHLADDFTEVGYWGRSSTRDEILELPVGPIEVTLEDIAVRAVGRDAALVTYRSVEPRGAANRSSLWRRMNGEWRLAFHQGTPVGQSSPRASPP